MKRDPTTWDKVYTEGTQKLVFAKANTKKELQRICVPTLEVA